MSKTIQHKRAFLIWLAIYPLITFLFWLLGGYLVRFPLPVRTLILTLVAVPMMFYVLIPLYNKIFAKWLNK